MFESLSVRTLCFALRVRWLLMLARKSMYRKFIIATAAFFLCFLLLTGITLANNQASQHKTLTPNDLVFDAAQNIAYAQFKLTDNSEEQAEILKSIKNRASLLTDQAGISDYYDVYLSIETVNDMLPHSLENPDASKPLLLPQELTYDAMKNIEKAQYALTKDPEEQFKMLDTSTNRTLLVISETDNLDILNILLEDYKTYNDKLWELWESLNEAEAEMIATMILESIKQREIHLQNILEKDTLPEPAQAGIKQALTNQEIALGKYGGALENAKQSYKSAQKRDETSELSDSAPDQTDSKPGQSGSTPAQSGSTPGQSGSAPGQTD